MSRYRTKIPQCVRRPLLLSKSDIARNLIKWLFWEHPTDRFVIHSVVACIARVFFGRLGRFQGYPRNTIHTHAQLRFNCGLIIPVNFRWFEVQLKRLLNCLIGLVDPRVSCVLRFGEKCFKIWGNWSSNRASIMATIALCRNPVTLSVSPTSPTRDQSHQSCSLRISNNYASSSSSLFSHKVGAQRHNKRIVRARKPSSPVVATMAPSTPLP